MVIQFQYLSQEPFRSLQDREQFRLAFNSIPGIDLRRDRLAGRPAFPLAALTEPSALAAFKAILDRIVDDTVDPLAEVRVEKVAAEMAAGD